MKTEKEKEKRLSSPFTIYYKLVVPIITISALMLFIFITLLHDSPVGYFIIGVGLLVVFLYSRYLFPLKHVWLGSDYLIVSSYSRKIRIPFHSITSIKENKWFNPRHVVITLRSDTEFGQRIIFTPLRDQKDIFRFMKDSAMTELLRDRVENVVGNKNGLTR